MGIIEKTKKDKHSQFISYDEVIHIISAIENCTTTEASEWLMTTTSFIKQQLILEKCGDFNIQEYKPLDHNEEYCSPIESLTGLIFNCYNNNDCYDTNNFSNYQKLADIGFSRKRALYSLVSIGLDIEQSLLDESRSYITEHRDAELLLCPHANSCNYSAEQLEQAEKKIVELKNSFNQPSDVINKLQAENEALKQRVFELENKNNTDAPDLLNKIMNPNDNDYYAPDLALSIQLYKYLYIDNTRKDSHSRSVDNWVTRNTGYNENQTGYTQSVGRLREITTPFTEWGNKRNKNYKTN